MRKALSLLSLAALTVGLLGSCSKINERIDSLEKKVNGIESEQIASIKSQVDAINTSIADLGTIRQNVQTLMNTTPSKENIEELRRADEALGRRIDELKSYTDGELKKYATIEWVKATFATLEQHQWTCDTIAKIDARIGALDANLSQSISGLESSLKQWVNEQLDAYYTAAQMDAKLDVMQNDINNAKAQGKTATDKADSIATELTTLKTAVDTAKANIRNEYKAAIQSAIETSEGKLTQALKDSIAKVNDKITALDTRVTTLEGKVLALEGKVDKLLAMIQSVSITPAYSDGSVEAENGILTLKCIVSPAEAISGMESLKDSLLLYADSVKVKTKATTDAYMTIEVTEASVLDAAQGAITLKADISEYLPKGENKALTVAVNIKNGISNFTTEFVPVYAVTVAPEGFVDLGVKDANGKPLYWAKCNLGASKPEEYGKYYSWGDVTGQTPSGSTFSKSFSWDNDVFGQSFNKVAQTTACPDGVLAQTYDAAYQTNNAWRMPTREDFSELAKQCFLEWTDNYNSTGVKGVLVWKAKGDDAGWFKPYTAGKGLKIKDDGSSYNAKEDHTFSNTYAIGTDPCVFFPAAGDCSNGTSLYGANTYGSYWSGSLFSLSPTDARRLYFGESNVNLPGFDSRYCGSPVRPVTSDAAPAPAPLPADGWKQIASTSEDQTFYSDPVFVGNNGKLYIAGIRNADQTAGRYPYALVADGKGGFETVTRDTCFIHKRADNVNIAFAPDNTMYAAFADYSKSSTPSTSVMKVTASEATYVGDTCALYRTNGTNPVVVFANTDAVYTANGVNSASGGIAKRCMNLTKYSAGSWTQAIAISGRPSDAYAYVSFSKATNGKKLDLVFNQNKGSYSCYDFAGKDPATVFEGIVVRNSDNTENLTTVQLPTSISSMGIDVDGDGNVYVLLYAKWDLANSSLGVVRLSYDSGSQVWNQSIIGGVIPNVSAKYGQASIAFDSDNVLHIAHTDENGKVVIRHIDKTTKLWSAPTVVGGKDYRSKEETPTFPDVKMINMGGKLYIMAMSQDTHMVDIYTTE